MSFISDVLRAATIKLANATETLSQPTAEQIPVQQPEQPIPPVKESIYDRAIMDPITGKWRLVDALGYARLYGDKPTKKTWMQYKYEHRNVMEEHLKRQLALNEIIHHIDGNRANNELANLKLVADHLEHIRTEHPNWRKGLTGREPVAYQGAEIDPSPPKLQE